MLDDGQGNPIFTSYTGAGLSSLIDIVKTYVDGIFYRNEIDLEDVFDEVDTFTIYIQANKQHFPFDTENLSRWQRKYFGYSAGEDADFFVIAFYQDPYTLIFYYDADAETESFSVVDSFILDNLSSDNHSFEDFYKNHHVEYPMTIDFVKR